MVHDFGEIILQHPGHLIDLARASSRSSTAGFRASFEFVGQFARQRGEIVDEVQRVLDLVSDTRGELAERGQLLGLDQTILRGAQIVKRFRQLARPRLDAFEQATFPMAITA